ncbi:MAG: cysteine desulfurase family protein [Candidatus Sericytochromatia bacterium]|nr:cysteine desulfurase family protein [Candidatus Sericytochromatia bacterium]
MVYLDHAASSPLRDSAREAWLAAVEAPGNPASRHAWGRRAAARVVQAREAVAALLGCEPAGLVFTATGTEANNLAILGAAGVLEAQGAPRRALCSAIEHSCVRGPMAVLVGRGWEVHTIGVDGVGRLDEAALKEALDRGISLASVMAVNNEMGVIQDLERLGGQIRATGALLHVDAVQALGVLEPAPWQADMLTASAHKIGGPQGIGALGLRRGLKLQPVLWGGPHEAGRRPGTLATAAIAAFGAAAAEALAGRAREAERLADLRALLTGALGSVPGLTVLGRVGHSAPHILGAVLPGVTGEAMVEHLDLAGVAASTGAACTLLGTPGSPVLRALGLPEAAVQGSLRLSFGWSTSSDEVRLAARLVVDVLKRLAGMKPMVS